eukprot:EG_transcript_45296
MPTLNIFWGGSWPTTANPAITQPPTDHLPWIAALMHKLPAASRHFVVFFFFCIGLISGRCFVNQSTTRPNSPVADFRSFSAKPTFWVFAIPVAPTRFDCGCQ